jgi:COP9 signalosome complex subunit 4
LISFAPQQRFIQQGLLFDMASLEVVATLASIADGPQSAKVKRYSDLLSSIVSLSSPPESQLAADLVAYSDSLLSSSLGIMHTRPLLTTIIQSLNSLSPDTKVTVGSHIVGALQSQSASFEEQDASVREVLATGYEAQEDYSAAAKALQGIHLETTQRQIADDEKVQMWTRIVRLYLEDDDTVSAETALNKIKNLPSATQIFKQKPDLKLYYQLSQARILDSRRKFLDASTEYFNVSLSPTVAEEDRLQALSAAIKTAILAGAGPARSRALGKLYKDERSVETEEYGILEKMFLDRLLSPAEVDAFASSLQPHQLAQTADGSTVLTKAVNEHNLLAASRLYENISTAALGDILGLSDSKDGTAAEKAEAYAAKMLQEGRLKGVIDQIEGVVIFEGQDGVKAGTAGSELRTWDHGVQGLVEDVEKCAAAISESFPVRCVLGRR